MAHLLNDTPTPFTTGLSGPAGASLDDVLGTLANTSPIAVTVLLLARQIIPAVVLVCMTRGATPAQRVALLQTYLGATTSRRRRGRSDQTRADPGAGANPDPDADDAIAASEPERHTRSYAQP